MAIGNASATDGQQTSYILAPASLKHLHEQRLHEKGFWLGCSKDFWIVLGTLVGTTLFSVAAVRYAVETSTRWTLQRACDNSFVHGLIPKPPRRAKFFGAAHLLPADCSETFSSNFELAFRAAIAFAACGATYWISPSLQDEGISMQYVAAMLAFMLWKDVGSTMKLIWTGFCGTALAVLNCIFIFYVYPSGTVGHGDFSGPWWFGMFNFWIFVFCLLGFQLSASLRMFALSWQAYFSMCFVNPNNTTVFTNNLFRMKLTCPAVNAIMGCMLGSQLAVLCTLLPSCLSSLGQTQDLVLQTCWEMGFLWERMLLHCADDHPAERARSFSTEISEFRKRCRKLDDYYNSSWWECFSLGRAGQVREQLQLLRKTMRYLNDWLEGALSAIRAADRGMASDKQLLRTLQPHLKEVIVRAWALLCHCSEHACNDASSVGDAEQVQQELLSIRAAQAALASAFVKARRQNEHLKEGNLAEHAFAHALSSYAECVATHALAMLTTEKRPAPRSEVLRQFSLPRLRPFTKEELLDFLQPALGYFVSFYIGLMGIGIGNSWAIPRYSSTIPGTMAFLIFSGGKQGSAFARTANRFMGVGVGTFLGQLMFFTSCMGEDIFGSALKSYVVLPGFVVATFFIELIALFFAFASPTSGYQGLLVGCFFAQHFMATCPDDVDEAKIASHDSLLCQFLAMFIATLIEILVDPPSDVMAIAHFARFADNFQSSLGELLLHWGSPQVFCRQEGRRVLDEAAESVEEAEKEFRGRKTPWRSKLAHEGLDVYSELWILLAVMEYVANAQTGQAARFSVMPMVLGAASGDRTSLLQVLDFPEIADTVQNVLSRADSSMSLFESLLGHSRSDTKFDDLPHGGAQLLLSHRKTHLKNLPRILEEVNARLSLRSFSGSQIVTEDEYCQVATLLTNVFHIALRLAHLESCLAEEPEIVWKDEPTSTLVLDAPSKQIHPVEPLRFQASGSADPNCFSSLGSVVVDSKSWCQPAMPYVAERRAHAGSKGSGSCGCLRLLV